MTLLDYFAGQALAGAMDGYLRVSTMEPEDFARAVYQIADAMLKERNKQGVNNG